MNLYSLTSINNLKKKTKLNLYLNDNNEYFKNALKMRKNHLSYFNNKIKIKKNFKENHPMPSTIYSISLINFKSRKKRIIEKFNIKNTVEDLMTVVNNFTDTLRIDDDQDSKTDKDNEEVSIASIGIKKHETETITTNNKKKISKDFFITNKFNKNSDIDKNKIKRNKTNFKNNLFFENYGKFKFTKPGILYPKRLKKYELPKYEGNNIEEKKYFEYRKKISFPEREYNRIGNFSEKFNKDLGKVSTNYNKYTSRTRFTEKKMKKKYMEILPIYEIYKDLKEIENRYIGTKYKFKLLPLYNKRITNLDKLADKFYNTQYSKDGLLNLLKIQSKKLINN